jgi:hypothetical protein
MKKYLKSTCITISFPYIYNDALTPVGKIFKRDLPINGEYDDDGDSIKYHNIQPILDLKNQGKTIDEIKELYFSNKIDFRYKERFEKSINILKQNEQLTDVKVSDYIINNHQS